MNCYISAIIGLGFLVATYSTISITEQQKNKLKSILSPENAKIYDNIVTERRNIYFQGLILGLIISFFLQRMIKTNNKFHKVSFVLAITIATSVIYYLLYPKSDYMLNHLNSSKENKEWLEVYKTMKYRYIWGFIIGSLSAIPIAYSFC